MTSVAYTNPEGLHAPPGQYRHAALSEPSRFLFIADQVGLDPHGEVLGPDDVGTQFSQAFASVRWPPMWRP